MKILVLGNEFLSFDALAKKVGKFLEEDFEVINIKDSFQLMTLLHEIESPIILDVVRGLKGVKEITATDLKSRSIMSAHDFDATQVIKLIGKKVRIIGIPMKGNAEEIFIKVKKFLNE